MSQLKKILVIRNPRFKDVGASILIGMFICISMLLLCRHQSGYPLSDLLLATNAMVTKAYPVWTYQNYDKNIDGGYAYNIFSSDRLEFNVDGKNHRKNAASLGKVDNWWWRVGDDPIVVDVEYVPWLPWISRIKGNGSQNLREWYFANKFIYVLLSVLFIVVCNLFRSGLPKQIFPVDLSR